MLCYVTLRYVTLCNVTLCYVMLCYVMLRKPDQFSTVQYQSCTVAQQQTQIPILTLHNTRTICPRQMYTVVWPTLCAVSKMQTHARTWLLTCSTYISHLFLTEASCVLCKATAEAEEALEHRTYTICYTWTTWRHSYRRNWQLGWFKDEETMDGWVVEQRVAILAASHVAGKG
jgi:hypothetical protein